MSGSVTCSIRSTAGLGLPSCANSLAASNSLSGFVVKFCCSLDFRSCAKTSVSKPGKFGALARWKALRPSRDASSSRSDFGEKILCSLDSGSSAQGTVSRPVKLFAGSFWETCMLPLPKYLISLPTHIRDRCDERRAAFLYRVHCSSKKDLRRCDDAVRNEFRRNQNVRLVTQRSDCGHLHA